MVLQWAIAPLAIPRFLRLNCQPNNSNALHTHTQPARLINRARSSAHTREGRCPVPLCRQMLWENGRSTLSHACLPPLPPPPHTAAGTSAHSPLTHAPLRNPIPRPITSCSLAPGQPPQADPVVRVQPFLQQQRGVHPRQHGHPERHPHSRGVWRLWVHPGCY